MAEFVGAEACAACHSDVVESFKGARHGKMLPKHKGIEFEKSCEACHGPGSLHAGAAGDKSDPGFKTIKLFKKLDTSAISNACMACHKDAGRTHWAGSSHDRRDVSCTACHSVHASASQKNDLIKATESETCYQCHRDVKGQMRRSAHMPVGDGKMECSSCHSPHGTSTPKLLKAETANQLCFACHQDKRGPMLWNHPPVKENCLTCHQPHGSHHDKMLTVKQPFLCQRCHVANNHPSTPYGGLEASQGNNKIMSQSCAECHPYVHGSNHPAGKYFTR